MKALIEITPSNRATYRQVLSGSKISVGRSSRSGISLPEEHTLHSEHFVIVPRESGCDITLSKNATIPFTYEGRTLRFGHVPWGKDIFIGSIRFRPMLQSTDATNESKSPRLVGLSLLLVVSSVWSFTHSNRATLSNDAQRPSPSPLFDGHKVCSEPNAALYRAREAEGESLAKMERYPFVE